MPVIPDDCEIDSSGVWMNTSHGNLFIAHQHNDVLAECPILFMDGTFKAEQNMFSQLLTIYGLYHDHVVSLA